VLSTSLHERPKPRLRGWFHLVAAVLSVPALIVLVALAPPGSERVGSAIYGLSLFTAFGVSALYHRFRWSERGQARMRAVDHAAIFVLIAGTYTPYCLSVLEGTTAAVVLAVVWTGAAAGIGIKVWRTDLHIVSGFLYVGLGWSVVVAFPGLVRALSPAQVAAMVAGCLAYTIGALVLATKWPDPSPGTFGFHEVWHAATVVAAACFYAVLVSVYAGA